jgi:drug/metabolite transporter (DMT)-like permease
VSRRGWILFGALSLIWGIPYLLIRISVREITPGTLIFLRTAPPALLLIPLIVRRGELGALLRRWRPLIVYSAIEIAVPWLLVTKAEERITSSLTGLLIAGVPLIGAFLARASGDEDRFDRRQWLGLFIGLLGAALLVGIDVKGATALPIAMVLLASVGYAFGPRLFSRRLSDLPNLGVVAASLAITAIAYAPFGLTHLPSHVSAEAAWSVVGLSLVCTAAGFFVFFGLIDEVGPVRATVVTYVNPAVALMLGITLLGEPFTLGIALGFPLVVLGSVLATRRQELPTRPGAPV